MSAPLSVSVLDTAANINHAHTSTVEDEAMRNLMMSWYYAGYYTGYYAGKQDSAKQQPAVLNGNSAEADSKKRKRP